MPITFRISATQHRKIMEILGIKFNSRKKEILQYGIEVKGFKKVIKNV